MRKRDPKIRYNVYIARNCMKIERIKDEKKEKVDEIRKEMKQKWIRKTLDHSKQNIDESSSTHIGKLGATTISK